MTFNRRIKTSYITNILVAVLALGFIFAGCEGPEGPQGPQGEQGAEGPQGPEGPEGPEGTANVIYSDWFTVGSWDVTTEFGDTYRYSDSTVTAIDQAIVDQGVVRVFAKFVGSPNRVYPFPLKLVGDGNYYFYHYEVDNLRIAYMDQNDSTVDPGTIGSSNEFRYVIIPGGVMDGSNKAVSEYDVRNMSYQELVDRFNIPE